MSPSVPKRYNAEIVPNVLLRFWRSILLKDVKKQFGALFDVAASGLFVQNITLIPFCVPPLCF